MQDDAEDEGRDRNRNGRTSRANWRDPRSSWMMVGRYCHDDLREWSIPLQSTIRCPGPAIAKLFGDAPAAAPYVLTRPHPQTGTRTCTLPNTADQAPCLPSRYHRFRRAALALRNTNSVNSAMPSLPTPTRSALCLCGTSLHHCTTAAPLQDCMVIIKLVGAWCHPTSRRSWGGSCVDRRRWIWGMGSSMR